MVAFEAGNYTVNWKASNKSSGIYFIELKAKQFRDIKKSYFNKVIKQFFYFLSF